MSRPVFSKAVPTMVPDMHNQTIWLFQEEKTVVPSET